MLPVFLSARLPWRRAPLLAAIVGSSLVAVGFVISPAGSASLAVGLGNRGLTLLAIWLTAMLAANQQRAEERLRASEARYRELVDNAAYGIYQATLAGEFSYVNRALMEMLGYESPEELLAKRLPADVYCDPASPGRRGTAYRAVGRK